MRWKLLRRAKVTNKTAPEQPDAWQRHIDKLHEFGLPEPGAAVQNSKLATLADELALYDVAPSFVALLPWVEYLPESQCMLLEDGNSVAAFFELTPLGTEGRESTWLSQARDSLENALQDSFDELEDNPWVVQFYAQDEASFAQYLHTLKHYVQPRAQNTDFTDFYLRFFAHHLTTIAKPGGLFDDTVVTRLPWRGQTRRVRMVVYRRANIQNARRSQTPEQALNLETAVAPSKTSAKKPLKTSILNTCR